jgi:hypothetical protein
VELVINEKKVVLRDKLPAELGWNIIVKKANILGKNWSDIEFSDLALLLSVAVESWELDGDPHDPAVYADLDMFKEFMPLATQLDAWVNQNMSPAKN